MDGSTGGCGRSRADASSCGGVMVGNHASVTVNGICMQRGQGVNRLLNCRGKLVLMAGVGRRGVYEAESDTLALAWTEGYA